MTLKTLLADFASRGVTITLVGESLEIDAPENVLTDADLNVLRSSKPDIIEHLRSDTEADDDQVGGVLCPRCRGRNLVDDPDGIRCHDCDELAFIDDGTALVRVDHVGDLDETTDPVVQRWLGHRDRILKAHATGKHDRHPGRVVPCPRCGGRMRPDDVVDGRQRFTCPTAGCGHVRFGRVTP